VSAPEPPRRLDLHESSTAGGDGVPEDARRAAVRRLETTAVGSLALQRLTALAARLVGEPSAQVSLIGEQQVIAGGVGLAAGSLGGCSPAEESLCTVAAAGSPAALVVEDAATDVVRHDTESAAAMGQLRGLLRGIAYRENAGPGEVLSGLDAAIEGLQLGTMATAAIARIEQTPEERRAGLTRLRWSNAGHPPPLVLHPDGRIEELAGRRADLMLGVDPRALRAESTATVARGATVLL
jgi:hypothetical protein